MGWESQSPTLTSTRSVVVQTTEYKYTHTTTVICTKDVVHTKYCLCVCLPVITHSNLSTLEIYNKNEITKTINKNE